MTPEELASNEDLNTFYRSLIAFQSTAIAYVSGGDGIEDRIGRAIEVTNLIYEARRPLITRGGCSDCAPDRECCNDGSCAQPGFCGIPGLSVTSQQNASVSSEKKA